MEEVKFSGGYIHCQGTAELYPNGEQSLQAAAEKQTLRDAYQKAMERHFPFSGKMPAKELFEAPVFNTWIELTFDQKDVYKRQGYMYTITRRWLNSPLSRTRMLLPILLKT